MNAKQYREQRDEARAVVKGIEASLPETFYAGEDVIFRVQRIVDQWRKLVRFENDEHEEESNKSLSA